MKFIKRKLEIFGINFKKFWKNTSKFSLSQVHGLVGIFLDMDQ
jgi:hypothetical protein